MSLLAIRDYLVEHHRASLSVLSRHFQCEPDLLKQLLRHWMRKGCVRCVKKTPNCGSQCFKCPLNDTEWYEWIAV